MRKAILFATVLFAATASSAIAQSSCASVYENAVANVSTSNKISTERSYVFNLYCRTSGETKEWVSSASVSFPLKGIPISASGDGDFTQGELEEFCEIGAEQNYSFGAEFGFNRDIAVDALTSFNQCVSLEREKGLVLSHQTAPPRSATISGQFKELGNVGTLDGVLYDDALVTCSSANFSEDGTSEKLHGLMARPIGTFQFSIGCERIPESLEEGQYYPRATVQVATSFGAYTVVMPTDTLFGFQTASAAEAANAEMAARVAAVQARFLEMRQSQQLYRNRYENTEVFRVVRGEQRPGTADFWETCTQLGGAEFTEAWMRNQCASKDLTFHSWKRMGSQGGGFCGYSFSALVCSGRP